MVKGILLCGGEGTRLRPLTLVANKHLQRIGNKMMVDYPFEKLIEAGITDIHVVVGGEHWPPVIKYLGSGQDRGVNISYSIQDQPGGIAQALGLCKTFAGNDKVCVILGDNIFDLSLRQSVRQFDKYTSDSECKLFTKKVPDPERFGVLTRVGEPDAHGDDHYQIMEKPKKPKSDQIVTGIYMYTPDVFDVIRTIKPSERGEMEISDVNNWYLARGAFTTVELQGKWLDCGNFESLHSAEREVLQMNGAPA